jgi:hypothetical protein
VAYLLVDNRDGRVLAQLASAAQAARLVSRFAGTADGAPPVDLVRFDHHQGNVVDITSMVSMRPLAPRARRRRRARDPH